MGRDPVTGGGSERAPVYMHGHHESVLRSHRWRTAENSAAYLLPHLEAGMSVLDVGAGPGTITMDLAGHVAPGRVTALERGEPELELSRAEARRRGQQDVDFVVGDVLALELDDDRFDVVHAHQVLQHVPDPVRALREMRRVCRPGGLVAVRDSDYGAFTWWPASESLDSWLSTYYRVARANQGEPDAGRRLLGWAHEAGFNDIVASSSTWCFANDEDRAWWGGLWADRVTASKFARQAVEQGAASEGQLAEMSTGWRAWSEEPDGWFSVLHGELLCRA